MDAPLRELVDAVTRTSPELADEWEAAALVESFGFTDGAVRRSLGFENTRALGRYIYQQSRMIPRAVPEEARPGLWERIRSEGASFARAFSSSFVYAVPWVALFAFEYGWPAALETRPELAGPISVALMVSLITSGGFVQAIARKGGFYFCMNQPVLARRVCLMLLRMGLALTVSIAAMAIIVGLYFDVFGAVPLLVAALYYVVLSLLWMTCAMLSLQQHYWRIPIVFLVAAVVFALVKAGFGLSTLLAQTLAIAIALGAAAALAVSVFKRPPGSGDGTGEELALPHTPVLVHSLAPYFSYGVAYFSFLFADRIAAGTAIPMATGLQFGLTPDYKRGIDLAFLAFLIVAGIVEYCNFSFMHFWYAEAKRRTPDELPTLTRRLAQRRRVCSGTIVGLFALIAGCESILAFRSNFLTTTGVWIFAFGTIGYGLFSLALFDGLMLFSLNRPQRVLRAMLPGLVLNLLSGYILSHALSVPYAVGGLVSGAALFAIDARRGVSEALRQSDYAYYAA